MQQPIRVGSLPLHSFAEANRCCPHRQGLWTKKTLFEVGTRVPLIIAAPHLPASHGQTTLHIAELVDVCESSSSHPVVRMLGLRTDVDDWLQIRRSLRSRGCHRRLISPASRRTMSAPACCRPSSTPQRSRSRDETTPSPSTLSARASTLAILDRRLSAALETIGTRIAAVKASSERTSASSASRSAASPTATQR